MLTPRGDRLAVWGDPIDHSRSPRLHSAAYELLGLPWEYDRRQVSEAEFPATLAALDDDQRGLSLTYPLKSAAFLASTRLDERARLTRAVNTLVFTDDGPAGFNTDVGGLTAALNDLGYPEVHRARIIGAGATATSALVALAETGADMVEVVARRPDAVTPLVRLGSELGVHVEHASFDDPTGRMTEVTIATLPGEAAVPEAAASALAATGGSLLDVVYGHWPTALASAWNAADAPAASGQGMLLHQAVLQVRIFVTGQASEPLEREDAVLDAMRAAIVGD